MWSLIYIRCNPLRRFSEFHFRVPHAKYSCSGNYFRIFAPGFTDLPFILRMFSRFFFNFRGILPSSQRGLVNWEENRDWSNLILSSCTQFYQVFLQRNLFWLIATEPYKVARELERVALSLAYESARGQLGHLHIRLLLRAQLFIGEKLSVASESTIHNDRHKRRR